MWNLFPKNFAAPKEGNREFPKPAAIPPGKGAGIIHPSGIAAPFVARNSHFLRFSFP